MFVLRSTESSVYDFVVKVPSWS